VDIQLAKVGLTGGERQFFELSKRWTNSGNEIHTVGSLYTHYLSNVFRSNMIMHIYNPLTGPPKNLIDLVNIKRMMEKVPNESFDFIYCPYELFEYVFASILLKNRLKIPLVNCVNLFEEADIKTFLLYFLHYKRYFTKLFLKKSDLIFCVSSCIKNLLTKIGIEKERIFSVGTGIDLEAIESIEPQQKTYDACYLGDITPRKGILDLVISWKAVTNEDPTSKLIIIGRRANEDYCRKVDTMINKLKLQDNIVMAGRIAEEEKYKLLKKSKIFVFPSYAESMSISVCEAMACELPVIVYDLPVYHEFYGNHIKYVKKGNPRDLTKAIQILLKDEHLQTSMKLRGAKRARQYSWEKVADYELAVIDRNLF
jgi:glycosyltransferase involved in cell wall biosynthesis